MIEGERVSFRAMMQKSWGEAVQVNNIFRNFAAETIHGQLFIRSIPEY